MTTSHTHRPNFGRLVNGCPRCAELQAGAEPVDRNSGSRTAGDGAAATTKHTCGGVVFGRLADPGACPRCDELHAGAEPVRWAWTETYQRNPGPTSDQIHAHFTSPRHNDPTDSNYCGSVCTAFDW